MNLTNVAIRQLQDAPFPDFITRPAIDSLVTEARKRLDRDGPHDEAAFARDMAQRAIAEHTDAANQQHYELPPEFFQLCLGERLKYSCCLYPTGAETLDQAEKAALAETCVHADLSDGQTILEMGCGWGSLSAVDGGDIPQCEDHGGVEQPRSARPYRGPGGGAAA